MDDPLTRQAVSRSLGQGLGRRPRQHRPRRLRHARTWTSSHALPSLYRGREHEDEMAGLFAHCAFNLNPRATSIDTPPHAFIPHAHVDHMHADAIIALAAARNGERLTREIFDGMIGWVPWQRPGFDLGLKVGALARNDARLRGVVLGGHGLFTWAGTSQECYRTTIEVIRRAAAWLDRAEPPRAVRAAGGAHRCPKAERDALDHRDRARAARLAQRAPAQGDAPPGHARGDGVRRTARARPSWPRSAPPVPTTSCVRACGRSSCRSLPAGKSAADLLARLPALVEGYRDEYAAYYDRCRRPRLAGHARPLSGDPARSRAWACSASRRTRPPRAWPPSST